MAAKVPDVAGAGYFIANPRSVTVKLGPTGTAFVYTPNTDPLKLLFGFADVDDGDTWTVSTTWRGPVPRASFIIDAVVTTGVSAHATISGTTLTVTYESTAASQPGWTELTLAGM